jgi:excisionase family DNA binding protein
MSDDKIAYTTNEAAHALGISRRSIFKEIAAGRLHALKPTRRKTLIPAESLRGWRDALPAREPVAA